MPLQDHCPVSPFESIAKMFLNDTGSSLAQHFENFEQTPIGAASLAQVHLATMKDTGKKGELYFQSHRTLTGTTFES